MSELMESVLGVMMWMFKPTDDPLRFMITLGIVLTQKALLGGLVSYFAYRKGRDYIWWGIAGALFFTWTVISLFFFKSTKSMNDEEKAKAAVFDKEYCSLPISVGALILGIWLITSLAKVNSA